MRFEREEGFFLGAYVMNYAAAAGLVAIVLAVVIAVEANDPSTDLVPIIAVGGLLALILPVLGYPFSRTLWTAMLLIMKPLEEREVVEADAAVRFGRGGRSES
jgi:hypothetical protein